MKRLSYILILALMTSIFASCSNSDVEEHQTKNKNIGLKLMVQNFKGQDVRSGFIANENQITNLYIILFAGSNTYKYDVTQTGVMDENGQNGGSWNQTDGEILLGLTQDDVGSSCDVYVFANVDAATKTALGVADDADDLKAISVSNNTPWSENFGSTLIMSGFKTGHNFVNEPILSKISMERAVAKLEINVTLTDQYQSDEVNNYMYRLVNFDKNTYLLPAVSPATKTNVLTSQNTMSAISGNIIEFVKSGSTVTGLKLTTYINERDNATGGNSTLELKLPFWDNGAPPPQFLDDIYSVVLDKQIERNHYYKVAVQM